RPQGRAGHQVVLADGEGAGVQQGKTVDILLRANGVDHRLVVQVGRQGQLHQDAVDAGIAVEIVDQIHQYRGAGVDGQSVLPGLDAQLLAALDLVGDVDVAGGVVTQQHHGDAGGQLVTGLEGFHLVPQLFTETVRETLAVDLVTHGQHSRNRLDGPAGAQGRHFIRKGPAGANRAVYPGLAP